MTMMTLPRLLAATLLAALVAATFAPAAVAAEPEGPTEVHRYALVIGTNDGGPGRAQLRFAVTDAQAFGTVLAQLGGVAAADQVVLAEATRDQVLGALDALAARIRTEATGKRTQLVLYYSGHADEYGLLLGPERLTFKTLRDRIEAMPVDVKIAVVDSCSSGALLRAKGGKHVKPFVVDPSNDVTGHAFLTSSSAHEVAQESDRLGGSFFTHHLVSGLRGAADLSGDGRVTLNEAYQFAFTGTLAHTERTRVGAQHPNYDFDLSGSGDIVITDVRQMTSRLVLDAELAGRFFIRDSHDRLVAEVDKVAGRTVELGIESGAYRVTTVRGGIIYAATVALASGHETTLIPGTLVASGPALAHRTRGPDSHEPVAHTDAPAAVVAADPLPVVARDFNDPADASVVAFRVGAVPGVGLPTRPGPIVVRGVDLGLLGDRVYRVDGAQLSGLVSISDAAVDGAQVSGVVNVTGRLDGAQIAGLVNVADDVKGAQVSGGVNHAGNVRGAQIGLINIAGYVKGAQIGLINVADSVDGVSLGLIPIINDGGYNHLEVYGDNTLLANMGVRFGAPYLHAVISGGVGGFDDPDKCILRLGAGLGTHVALGSRLYLDFDLGGSGLAAKDCDFAHFADDEVLFQFRTTLGVSLTPALALFVGVAANAEVSLADNDLVGPLLVDDRRDPGASWETVFFPSFYAGVRLF